MEFFNTQILQAIYYTIVIIGAAWALQKASSKRQQEVAQSIVDSNARVLEGVIKHESKHISLDSRITELDKRVLGQEASTHASMDELKKMIEGTNINLATINTRIDQIFNIVVQKEGTKA